jgi:YD repeat-containing protein
MRGKLLTPILFGLLAEALTALAALANVSVKNGNFFIGYTDVVYPGGFEPKIERVYNSKSPFKGAFGWGWGSEYELYLDVMGDGSLLVHEYGGGAENLFSPTSPEPGELEAAVEAIISAATQARDLTSSEQTNRYRARLRNDAIFRSDEWTKYVKARRLTPRRIEVGARFTSNRFNYQYIVRTADGYQRYADNGRQERFDDQGRLVELTDQNANWVRFTYGANGRWSTLEDNFGRKLRFAWRADGLMESVTRDDGKRATYRYNAQGELIGSRDVDGNAYTFSYSPDGRHNLTRIGYADGTRMEISYHPIALQENVKSVRDRDGTLTEYDYQTPATDRLVVNVRTTANGAEISKSSYEYVTRLRSNGEEWTQRIVTVLDGERTETDYNECCGLPVRIVRGQDTTRFAYDPRGRVTYKESGAAVDSLEYDARIGKVASVVRIDKPGGSRAWSRFYYDDRGNLQRAENSDSLRVTLSYDANGRVSTLQTPESTISFQYDRNSKPVEIRDSKLGAIRVTYDRNGAIAKVDSDGGPDIALRIEAAFERLMDLVRPAGVTLTF